MIDCPNCRNAMAPQRVEIHGVTPRTVEVGTCGPCNLYWFDDANSVGLTAQGVLELFRYMGQAGPARNPLAARFGCPRCQGALTFTHDLQRATRFTFWRCANDHGQLMTFGQFMAEKNFVRPPSADELARLRATVRQVNCSQCGAPIDLWSDAACPHCGAAVALIDTDGIAKALRELAAQGAAPGAGGAESPGLSLREAELASLLDRERVRDYDGGRDLLAIGATAIAALVDDWLVSE